MPVLCLNDIDSLLTPKAQLQQIFIMHFPSAIALLTALPSVLACKGYTGGLPKHTGTKTLSAPQYIKKGQTFDAGWVKYDRGVKCTGQDEGGKSPEHHDANKGH